MGKHHGSAPPPTTTCTTTTTLSRRRRRRRRRRMMMTRRVGSAALAILVASCLVASCARAQDCDNLDPSTLDMSNPTAFASLLPCTGWDQTCQSNVMAAGASCIQEIQAIMTWANTSGATDDIESATGLSAKSMIEARIPDLKTALGTCCGGAITPTCCSAMTPVITGKCLCQEKPVELLKSFLGQDPSEFIGVAQDVLGQLGCSALDGAQVYPQCQA